MESYDDVVNRLRNPNVPYSPAEQRIAEIILKNPDLAVKSSILELAQRANVSEPSVTRFCRRMGCDGVKDFKLKLAQNLASGAPFLHRSVNRDDDSVKIVRKVFSSCTEAFNQAQYYVENHIDSFQKAINALVKADRVDFYGSGDGSSTVAHDARMRFFRLNMSSNFYSDSQLQMMASATSEPGDVIFAISTYGKCRDLLDALKVANQFGATTIGLTTPGSPLARTCDIPLLVDNRENTDLFTPSLSRLVYLAILDFIAIGVGVKKGSQAEEKLKRIKESLIRQRSKEDTTSIFNGSRKSFKI